MSGYGYLRCTSTPAFPSRLCCALIEKKRSFFLKPSRYSDLQLCRTPAQCNSIVAFFRSSVCEITLLVCVTGFVDVLRRSQTCGFRWMFSKKNRRLTSVADCQAPATSGFLRSFILHRTFKVHKTSVTDIAYPLNSNSAAPSKQLRIKRHKLKIFLCPDLACRISRLRFKLMMYFPS